MVDIGTFSAETFPDVALRDYQIAPAQAIIESVLQQRGEQHAVVFSRQAGKDELLAQMVCFLLAEHEEKGGSIILAAPTFKPQGETMRERLLDRLRSTEFGKAANLGERNTVRVGRAVARFLSASPLSNVRGQTASLLLVANEAQDIDARVWDAAFDPMAATTNATTVFMGTVWSRDTLLARQMRYLDQSLEIERGQVWKVAWEIVASHLPAYGARVEARIAQFGRDHPAVRTEYFLEELDDAGALFTELQLTLMQGDHLRQTQAEGGADMRC